ncbi:hypothetical protein ACH5RR_007338 [Cinchona calisaya]|uniref:Aminotransferase-like plant mobile domain-containing protein n=1 Tax=Cinchona calisaya TaxID=153742 RepID=A0ABD3AS05_9GENT
MARKSSEKCAVESPEREISKSVLGKVYVHSKAADNFDVGDEVENFLQGSYIFPSSSSGYMRAIYGRFVTKVDKIKSFSWGEAALVEIHNSLFEFCKDAEKKSSKESKAGVGGCMFALMAFAFQYIRPLRKLYKVEELSREMLIQTSFPLACRWAAKLIKTLKSSYPDVRLVQLNECLDNLKFDDIYWNPYDRTFKRRGNKNYWKLWKEKLLMDVMDSRNQIHTQPWLLNEDVEQHVLPQEQQELPHEQQELPHEQQEFEVAVLLSSLDSIGHVEEAANENKPGEMRKPRWLSRTIQDRPFDSPEEQVRKRRDAPKYPGMQA